MSGQPIHSRAVNLLQTLQLTALVLIAAFNIPAGTLSSAATAAERLGGDFARASACIQTTLLLLPPLLLLVLQLLVRLPRATLSRWAPRLAEALPAPVSGYSRAEDEHADDGAEAAAASEGTISQQNAREHGVTVDARSHSRPLLTGSSKSNLKAMQPLLLHAASSD